MTWEEMEDALHQEEIIIGEIPHTPSFDVCWQESNWAIREEHSHNAAIQAAFQQRLENGSWPSSLTPLQRWLVAFRLRALIAHIDVLEAWGCPEMPSVECAIKRVAVDWWPKIRWFEHAKASVHLPINETDDPFEPGMTPRWLEG